MKKVRIGIVGSRRRNTLADRMIVYDIVRTAIRKFGKENVVIVSGACSRGADHFAAEAAKVFGVELLEFPVPLDPPIAEGDRNEYRKRAFARNRLIVENSGIVFALVHEDRKGGTENTVWHCKDLKVPYDLR